jgi:tetratricopeptide (TPR) repeat protein
MKRIQFVCLVACFGLMGSLAASSSFAQGAGDEPSGYREMVEEAVREFAANNYEESRALFNRAHGLYPNARTYRGLGFAEFELRHYDESVRHLEAALASAVRPLTAELKTDTVRMLARANNFVARVHVDAKPGAVRVMVDGSPVELKGAEPVLLTVGDHAVQVEAPGFVTQTRKLSVQGGEEKTLTLLLVPAPAPTSEASTAKAQRAWYKSPWLWGSVGVLAAGAAVGTGVALSRDDTTASSYGGSANTRLTGP